MTDFQIRNVKSEDLDQLVTLEEIWPVASRASKEELSFRIKKFPQGFFVAEDDAGIFASIICYPYVYHANDLSNFQTWSDTLQQCYQNDLSSANALYIISGTNKRTDPDGRIFDGGVNHVVELAKQMAKDYVVGGALIPGYARYLQKHKDKSATDYVFEKLNGRCVDPLLEKYRRLNFYVPDKNHVLVNYFPHKESLNYSALVVRKL